MEVSEAREGIRRMFYLIVATFFLVKTAYLLNIPSRIVLFLTYVWIAIWVCMWISGVSLPQDWDRYFTIK